MKKLIALLSLLVAFTSCELKHDDINLDQIFMSDLYGKWEIKTTGGLEYSSIEFSTEGYYFIEVTRTDATANQEVLYGKYSKVYDSDYQIALDGLGVIEITDYTDEKLYYDITLEGKSSSYSQYAKADDRDEEISTNSDTIGTIWSVSSYVYEAFQEQHERETDIAYIYLSTSGTFISIDKNGDATSYEWTWSDSDETEIQLSNGSSYTNWTLEGKSNFSVKDLSAGDMKFMFTADVDHTTEEDGVLTTERVTDASFTMDLISTKRIEF